MQIRTRMCISADTGLTLEHERALPGGSVEIVYACTKAEVRDGQL
jgi:hypothetical protein